MDVKKTNSELEVTASYKVSSKPLDFSFLKIVDVAQLRKEVARGGTRRPIPESDDEEDMKKVSLTLSICRTTTPTKCSRRKASTKSRRLREKP